MSSQTFNRFLKQLSAQGREKADGFDSSHFDGMTSDERLEAARLLRDALLAGDSTAIRGLVLLDEQSARPTLEDALQKLSGDPSASLILAEELWKITNESRYQDVMVALLKHPDHSIRRRALGGLQDTPHNDRLMGVLQTLVLDDPNKTVRFWAATHLIYGLGLIKDFYDVNHPYIQTLRDLSSDNKEFREKTLAELYGRFSNLP
jgi:hypothetical protein